MMLTSLLIIFSLNFVTLGSVPEQDKCGGPLSAIEFDDIADACDYYARCAQPTYKLNSNCILLSCPSLSGLCPMNSNGSVNNTALNTAVSTLNTCIGQEGLICGINMSHNPLVQLGWTTKNLLPPNVVNGTVNINPGTGFLNNLNKAKFILIQKDNPGGSISLYIQAPNITMNCHFTCTFNLTENSFIRSLKRQLTSSDSPNSLNIPDMFGTYTNDISTLISIEMSTSTPTINILNDHSNMDLLYSNFTSLNGEPLPQSLVVLFNQKMQNYVNNSAIISTTINFLSTYIALGLQAAQLNCP